ncbi:MAG: peptidoglycan D,D-transpeptidase FtsI family protein [Flavobacteriales bacterium]
MNLDNRKFVLAGLFITVFLLFFVRLFYMQILEDESKDAALRITEKRTIIRPNRGLIVDRNGALLVTNQPVYDLMVTVQDADIQDTVALANLVGMPLEKLRERLEAARKIPYREYTIQRQISIEDYSRIAEQLHRFPGLSAEPNSQRRYVYPSSGNLFGYVSKVDSADMAADPYYDLNATRGKTGMELAYEEQLRGTKGIRYYQRDNRNVIQTVAEGKYNVDPVAGKALTATLDGELQAYAERLLQNKTGCVIAIEPATGEILTLVTSPTYDPNMLVGRKRGANYAKLSKDSTNRLFNLAIQGQYRPGSIFKMVQSLIALEDSIITPNTRFRCNRNLIGCHGPHSKDDLRLAIRHSCNPYFYQTMKRYVERGVATNRFKDAAQGLKHWENAIRRFGFGTALGTDVPGMVSGNVPGVDTYDGIYGQYRWAFSTIYSIAIGEGEMEVVPMQMANLAAILANRGWYIPPHLVKDIGGEGKLPQFYSRKETGVSPEHFEVVVAAMSDVVNEEGGTARLASIKDIEVCGKTGTVQNDHLGLPDHSVFMAFAPRENPQIAVAVYVEYAGFGGNWAGPIASLVMEKYLTDSISNPAKEQRILDAAFPKPTPKKK